MKHRIGYACINTSISATTNKTCKLANCTDEKLKNLILNNLTGLKEIIKWNDLHNIYLYRISSVIIPFASHPVNTLRWWDDYKTKFHEISQLIKKTKMRVSMHPGQYVNINSSNAEVVKSSIKELEWHVKFLDTMDLDASHRLIFHVGGIYSNKKNAIKRFIKEFSNLPDNFKSRLTLENDDKNYTIWDVLSISEEIGIPVIFDNLHHKINNTRQKNDENIDLILNLCFNTWNDKTGIPKIHYSSQKIGAKPGSHAESINLDEFVEFYFCFNKYDFDIMFETKDKEKSVLEAFKRLEIESAKRVNISY